jgi:hypothetical protein
MKKERTQSVSDSGLDERGIVIAFLSSIVFAFTADASARGVSSFGKFLIFNF